MIVKAPQIGFDRFIQLDWVAAALGVRAGKGSLEELSAQLTAAGLGKEALAKTQTKLNALVLEPRADLVVFIGRGVRIFAGANTPADVAPFAWGAALAAYPYFGRVAEFTGRLTSIQGDCSVAEINRRMSEVYGDREVTKRATRAVIQTQGNWGVIKRVENDKRLVRLPARSLTNDEMVAWLVEAALHYQQRPMPLATLQSLAVIYPFILDQPLAYLVSVSPTLEVRAEGSGDQFVALRARF
ncbi:hypothetical protein [Accumulibacter sp.]|uniref:hypothetical protein n=1 Tax=Accumulibacter sp. TaxID=2053492 RepID=UPI0025F75D71|nr:hypothetical protein [Accumulibacter sp.]MCM8595096.1 hypothetical protein [Accumulibacter sp.]MDS4049242.1 hypothetical protein [Accumulibacter sp.]